MDRPAGCSVTLVTRDILAPYSGMLPGHIAGHYSYAEGHIDVRPLARMAAARVCQSEVDGIDLEKRLVLCPDRPAISFDLLSINIGARPTVANVPGAREHALPAKPVDAFIEAWQRIQRDLKANPRPYRFVVVGAGAGGVELTLSMQHRLRQVLDGAADDIGFDIISASDDIVPTHNKGVQNRMSRVLRERGIKVHTGTAATEVSPTEVHCDSGLTLPYNTLIWTTQAAPASWIAGTGLATDERGFIAVDDRLRSVSHPFVFAAGDVASLQESPRPKSGVFAVRAGPYLEKNLRHALAGEALEPFKPQKEFLSLISTGDKNAIASRAWWSAEGRWVWRWKDYIDRTWMSRYRLGMDDVMREMAARPAPRDDDEDTGLPCAGCGAKLGHVLLEQALTRLESVERHDVLVGLDAPDDAAVVEPPPGKLAVHALDYFPALVADAYLFGKIAANHCLSDIYAMGAEPHTALAMATIPHADPQTQENDLADVLAGALSVLMPEHTALIGGHTIEAEQFTFGLSVNGFIDRERLLRKSGLRAGDRLILTKPVGVGVVFAADMRSHAQTHWLDEAIEMMLQSNAQAARLLFDFAASACTDISGFGLAGHLLEMLRQSRLCAEVDLACVPILRGARAASHEGFRSSLFPKNKQTESEIDAPTLLRGSPSYPLLFDPQTAGGLLAGVAPESAERCVDALHAAGYADANIVGTVLKCADTTPPLRLV